MISDYFGSHRPKQKFLELRVLIFFTLSVVLILLNCKVNKQITVLPVEVKLEIRLYVLGKTENAFTAFTYIFFHCVVRKNRRFCISTIC